MTHNGVERRRTLAACVASGGLDLEEARLQHRVDDRGALLAGGVHHDDDGHADGHDCPDGTLARAVHDEKMANDRTGFAKTKLQLFTCKILLKLKLK